LCAADISLPGFESPAGNAQKKARPAAGPPIKMNVKETLMKAKKLKWIYHLSSDFAALLTLRMEVIAEGVETEPSCSY